MSSSGPARAGVLIREGAWIVALAGVKVVAFGPTGTLTERRPRVVATIPFAGHDRRALVALAAALGSRRSRLFGQAAVREAATIGTAPTGVEGLETLPDGRVVGRMDAHIVWLGSPASAKVCGLATPEATKLADDLAGPGRMVVLLGDRASLWGVMVVANALRPEAPQALAALRAAGIGRIVALACDGETDAATAGLGVGVDEVRAVPSADAYAATVRDLMSRSGPVMLVHAASDVPATKHPGCGITLNAIGDGAALGVSDATVMSDRLSRLPWLLRHCRRARTLIRLSVLVSVGAKLMLAIGTAFGTAPLWGAVLSETGAMLLAVFGAFLLLRARPAESFPARDYPAAPGIPPMPGCGGCGGGHSHGS